MPTSTPLSMMASAEPASTDSPREVASTATHSRVVLRARARPPARDPVTTGDPVRAWTAVKVQGSQAAPAMRSMCTIWADMYPAKAKVAAPNRAPVDEID